MFLHEILKLEEGMVFFAGSDTWFILFRASSIDLLLQNGFKDPYSVGRTKDPNYWIKAKLCNEIWGDKPTLTKNLIRSYSHWIYRKTIKYEFLDNSEILTGEFLLRGAL